MNPMVRKELWQRMREPRAWWIFTLYLAALGAIVAFAYFSQVESLFLPNLQEVRGAQVGVSIFFSLVFGQLTLLLLLAPAFSAGSFTIEKEQRTLSGLLTSLLTAAQIWMGKFIAAMLYLTLLLFSSLPVLSLAFAFGGVRPKDVLIATGMSLFVLACLCSVGLYCSSYFRRSVHATAACYGIIIALTVLTAVIFAIEQSLKMSRQRAGLVEPDYPGFSPLFLNPFTPVMSSMGEIPNAQWYPLVVSVLYFCGFALLAFALAIRNLERSGEQL